jgi:hypothetical protein
MAPVSSCLKREGEPILQIRRPYFPLQIACISFRAIHVARQLIARKEMLSALPPRSEVL